MKLQTVTSRNGTFIAKRHTDIAGVWQITRSDDERLIVAAVEGDVVTLNFQAMHVDELADIITLLLLLRINKFFDILQTLKITDL